MTRIPTAVGAGNVARPKGANGGARKSITRPSVGNGFTSAVEADDDEEIDPDAEDGDIVEEDGEAEVEGEADGWIDEEVASLDPDAEDDDQEEEEEGGEEEEEEAGSEIAADAVSVASAGTKVDSEAEDAA
jgi:hypothetical protein